MNAQVRSHRKAPEVASRDPSRQPERQSGDILGRHASSAMIFAPDGHGVLLGDMYRGRPAFLLCSGPSLITHDLRLLQQRGVLTCAVNNAAAVFRPHLWVSVDSPAHFCDAIWRDPAILKFVPVPHLHHPVAIRDDHGQLQLSREVVRDMPAVFAFQRNDTFVAERWLYEETFNWGNQSKRADAHGNRGSRSVMYVALRLLFFLGIRRLYLLGCDFRMERGKANYAFPQRRSDSSIRGNNRTYDVLKDRLTQLLPYFEKEDYRIFNCTPNSGLTVFPHISYEEAVAEVCSAMPQEIITEGMYDQGSRKRQSRKSSAPRGRRTGRKPARPAAPQDPPQVAPDTAAERRNSTASDVGNRAKRSDVQDQVVSSDRALNTTEPQESQAHG